MLKVQNPKITKVGNHLFPKFDFDCSAIEGIVLLRVSDSPPLQQTRCITFQVNPLPNQGSELQQDGT